MLSMPTFELHHVRQARERISAHVARTPCILSEPLSRQLGCRLYLKAENLQHAGAFKSRGALNAVLELDEATAARGVVTHSSGNHAAALARAARLRGIDAHIVMPENAARHKVEAVRSLGIEPHFCAPDTAARQTAAEAIRRETGATLVHPFDQLAVMAGQGTVALEILEQVPQLDSIIAPVGGGGLLAGILTACKTLQPQVRVFGAEPAFADDARRSLASGRIEMPTRYDTIADGLRTCLGTQTFPVIQTHVDGILLVTEDEIRRAMRRIAENAHLVAEPSGAVAFAAAAAHAEQFRNRTVVVVISGGNVDFGQCQLGQTTSHASGD